MGGRADHCLRRGGGGAWRCGGAGPGALLSAAAGALAGHRPEVRARTVLGASAAAGLRHQRLVGPSGHRAALCGDLRQGPVRDSGRGRSPALALAGGRGRSADPVPLGARALGTAADGQLCALSAGMRAAVFGGPGLRGAADTWLSVGQLLQAGRLRRGGRGHGDLYPADRDRAAMDASAAGAGLAGAGGRGADAGLIAPDGAGRAVAVPEPGHHSGPLARG